MDSAKKLRLFLVIFSCALSVLTGLVLARGGKNASTEKAGKKILIGLSLDTLTGARWQADSDLFTKRANELGADVLVQSANSDDTRQISDVQGLISRKVDVLVIVPHNGTAMAKAVDMAHEAGIPVLAYDRLIKDCNLDVYVTFDNVKVGELQAQFLVDELRKVGKKRIVRVYGSKTDNNAFLFKQGQDNILNPLIAKGDIVVLHEDWADGWKADNAKKIVNAAITKAGHTIDGILDCYDGTAGGGIQALLEEGIAGKVIVTGQDADLAGCQRIVGGTQAMTIYKPLKKLATRGAEVAVKLATGKPIYAPNLVNNGKLDVPSILLDVVLVTKDNLRETVIADGFQKEEQVYHGTKPE
jgi:D-xylose transport system substrate-binding protein